MSEVEPPGFSYFEKAELDYYKIIHFKARKNALEWSRSRNIGAGLFLAILAVDSQATPHDLKTSLVWLTSLPGSLVLLASLEIRRNKKQSKYVADRAAELSLAKDIVPPAWVLGKESYEISTADPSVPNRQNLSFPALESPAE